MIVPSYVLTATSVLLHKLERLLPIVAVFRKVLWLASGKFVPVLGLDISL